MTTVLLLPDACAKPPNQKQVSNASEWHTQLSHWHKKKKKEWKNNIIAFMWTFAVVKILHLPVLG